MNSILNIISFDDLDFRIAVWSERTEKLEKSNAYTIPKRSINTEPAASADSTKII